MAKTVIASIYTVDFPVHGFAPKHLYIFGFTGLPDNVMSEDIASAFTQLAHFRVQNGIGEKEEMANGEYILKAHKDSVAEVKSTFGCGSFIVDSFDNNEEVEGNVQNVPVVYPVPNYVQYHRLPAASALLQLNYYEEKSKEQKLENKLIIQKEFQRIVRILDKDPAHTPLPQFGPVVEKAVAVLAKKTEKDMGCVVTAFAPHIDACILNVVNPGF